MCRRPSQILQTLGSRILLILASIILLYPGPLPAQDLQLPDTEEETPAAPPAPVLPTKDKDEGPDLWGPDSEIFKSLNIDMQKAILLEAEDVYQDCEAKKMYSQLHDCRCIAVYYVDQRLRGGPDVHRNQILPKIGRVCPDAVSTAGYAYQKCMNIGIYQKYKNTEEFCSCYANEAARIYVARPVPKYSYFSRITAQAASNCQNVIEED